MKCPLKLLNHPLHLRIIKTLRILELASTQAICDFLDDVPSLSIYRHLRLMHEGGLIDVVETRTVNGSIERLYELRMPTGTEDTERNPHPVLGDLNVRRAINMGWNHDDALVIAGEDIQRVTGPARPSIS